MSTQTLTSTINQTLLKFLNGYIDASAHNDASLLSGTLHPDCKRRIAPASFLTAVGAPADLVLDVKGYEGAWAREAPTVAAISVDVTHKVIQTDPEAPAASVRTFYVNRFVDGTEFKGLDLTWFLKFTPDGTQITEILEIADGLVFVKYQAKVEEVLAKLNGEKGN